MSERRYYIVDWCDEVVPCSCSLEGWAQWLSKPDPAWNRPTAEKSGSFFTASVTRFEDLVLAEPAAGELLSIPDPYPAGDWFALRHGPGMGWDPDNIAGDLESLVETIGTGASEAHIACAHDEGEVSLRYDLTADGPRVVVVGSVGVA